MSTSGTKSSVSSADPARMDIAVSARSNDIDTVTVEISVSGAGLPLWDIVPTVPIKFIKGKRRISPSTKSPLGIACGRRRRRILKT